MISTLLLQVMGIEPPEVERVMLAERVPPPAGFGMTSLPRWLPMASRAESCSDQYLPPDTAIENSRVQLTHGPGRKVDTLYIGLHSDEQLLVACEGDIAAYC